MNKNIFDGKWDEFKGEVRKAWGKITGDELESTKGDVESISGLIQQKYGHTKEDVAKRLTELKDSLRESKAKDSLN